MITHKLKISPNYLKNLLDGKKKAEVRFNDRDYQVGDWLEFVDEKSITKIFRITHIHSGLGLQTDYVLLSLEALERINASNDKKGL